MLISKLLMSIEINMYILYTTIVNSKISTINKHRAFLNLTRFYSKKFTG